DVLAADSGLIWVADGSPPGSLIAVDENTDRVVRRVATTAAPIGIAARDGSVWAISATPQRSGRLTRYSASTGHVLATINLPGHPNAVTVGFGSVWVAVTEANLVLRLDPSSNAVIATIPVGWGPNALAAGEGRIWVTSGGTDTLAAIDPGTNRVSATAKL